MQTLVCMSCGTKVTGGGASFYCDGCNGYLCWNCGMLTPKAEDKTIYLCPNCNTPLQQVNM